MTISVVLLAGGKGLRLGGTTPKQYLPIHGKPLAHYSLDVFLAVKAISEIVVVCDPEYIPFFPAPAGIHLRFALPGERRQDSVYNGVKAASPQAEFICVHDAARPLVDSRMFQRAFEAARTVGASTVAMPLKFTIKETCDKQLVVGTPDRSRFWEIQTPQIIRKDWLVHGLQHALENDITVTDDVSAVELIGHPVKLVEGSHANIKVTTTEDLLLAERLLG